jgi:Flp pilus assembly protein TadB
MMRQMSQETGEEMGPEFDEVIDRLEAGQSPEDIEEAMPELSEEGGMGGGDFDDY